MAPDTFYIVTQYSFKNELLMHGNDYKVNLNLESLFKCNFWNDIIFFLSLFRILARRKNITLFYIVKALEHIIFCVKTEKNHFNAFHGSLTPKTVK